MGKRQERLWKRREEMIERLSYAQNEILCALDFVSLLISKQWVPAQNSMSPALKEAVPVGTLAGRVLRNKPVPPPVRRQLASPHRVGDRRVFGLHQRSYCRRQID